MSYWNPTPDEAYDQYYYNKRKYEQAYSQQKTLDRQRSSLENQQAYQKDNIKNLRNDKLNFEKRLKGLKDIIDKLESSGGMFKKTVPASISATDRLITEMANAYERSIVVTGISRSDISNAFKVKQVSAHHASSSALQEYKVKYAELQTAIENVNKSINNAENEIRSLKSRISDINDMQRQLRMSMRNYTMNMNHYRSYI